MIKVNMGKMAESAEAVKLSLQPAVFISKGNNN